MLDYQVKRIVGKQGRDFICKHHYSHGCHNGPMTFGLFDEKDELIGVCAFATPCSENVRASVFGATFKHTVTELHRLVILDQTPKNTESWFVSRCLKMLKAEKPYLQAVISFADSTEGHVGTIYQALNALYCGTTGRAKFYRDSSGRLRHPRQNGINISQDQANERGWTTEMRDAKHRYLFLLGGPAERRNNLKRVKLNTFTYPKKESHCLT